MKKLLVLLALIVSVSCFTISDFTLFEASAESASTGEARLGYGTRGDRVKEIQERLAELGYFSGSIDGNFGNSTKEAVELFQEDNSLDVTGIVSNEELDLLFSEDVSPRATETPIIIYVDELIITADNNEEFSTILSLKDEFDPQIKAFANKYAGRTIEFNGNIVSMANHGGYSTRYDILVLAGDYSETNASGPYFQFEDVGVYDLGLSGLYMSELLQVGDNVHIVAEIEEFNSNSGLFELDPVSVTQR